MVNIDKAIDNALTLFETDLMTDVTLELTTSNFHDSKKINSDRRRLENKSIKDEDDFIIIDGIRYEKEIANKSSNIKLESLYSTHTLVKKYF